MSAPDPIPPDTNYAPNFLITSGLVSVLAVGLCIARIYSRISPTFCLSLDDYFIATAAVHLTSIFFRTNNDIFIDTMYR